MKKVFIGMLILIVVGCASPITREEAQDVTYNCSDVDEKISILLKEKDENNQHVLNGVKSVFPVAAIVNLIRGRYTENVAIATGDWAEVLDKKIAEMQTYQRQCQPE